MGKKHIGAGTYSKGITDPVIYSVVLANDGFELSLQIMEAEVYLTKNPQRYKSVKFHAPSEELIDKVGDTNSFLSMFHDKDVFWRARFEYHKFAFDALFGDQAGTISIGDYSLLGSSKAFKLLFKNLILTTPSTLSYLAMVSKEATGSYDWFTQTIQEFPVFQCEIRKDGHVRKRLGMSKNKEKMFRKYPSFKLLTMDNSLFDNEDEMSFMSDFLEKIAQTRKITANIAVYLLQIKNANRKLKIDAIIAKVIKQMIFADNVSFLRSFDRIADQAIKYEKFVQQVGYPFHFYISNNSLDDENYEKVDGVKKNDTVKINVDGCFVTRVKGNSLNYALMLSNAYDRVYVKDMISQGYEYYLASNRREHFMIEVYNGVATSCRQNGNEKVVDLEILQVEERSTNTNGT